MMRDMKSSLEDCDVGFECVEVREDSDTVQRLRQLSLMHVPGSMTSEVKATLAELTQHIYEGQIERVLYGCIMTCPWYAATQDERGQQAKHNTVFIVYQSRLSQVLAPVNHQYREKHSELTDLVSTVSCMNSP